ncbi:serine-rich adhesin for platelets-like [Planococcus citri]|uniref:serine-rich adhesin for platelets-like n=1 Tax=Planococcus citri TaxID=170843 RepID=UPI0031F80DEE
MQLLKMDFHRCCGIYPTAKMTMRQSKHKSSATKKSTIVTVVLALVTMTVIDTNYQVAGWPMVESPSPWPRSTPSSSSSKSPLPSPLPSSSPAMLSTSEELDSDTSRKVLGSSVVTSVSVVMNSSDGKNNASLSTTPTPAFEDISISSSSAALSNSTSSISSDDNVTRTAKPSSSSDDNSRMDDQQQKSNLIASPGNLMNPDKYEFYTFDEAGDLVKRLMSWDEIQGLIAASDTDGLLGEAVVPMYYNENVNGNVNTNGIGGNAATSAAAFADKLHDTHLTANEFQMSDVQDVRKVVESVQNVLKSELAAAASSPSKIIPAVKPSSANSNPPNWSSLFLPNFLENIDEAAFVDLQHDQHLSTNDVSATTAPIRHYSSMALDKFSNMAAAAAATSLKDSTTTSASSSPVVSESTLNKGGFVTSTMQSTEVTASFKNSITASTPTQKFTRIKNTSTAGKPINFKYSPSTTSERVWSSPNLLASNFTVNSQQPSSASSPSQAPSSSSFLTHPYIPHLPSSMITSWPVKTYSSTKLATGSALKNTSVVPSIAADASSATNLDQGTVKTTTTSTRTTGFAIGNENSTLSQPGTSVTNANRDSFTAALTNLLNQINNDQRQTTKIRPSVDSLVYDSSSATTEMASVSTAAAFGQRNATALNSIPVTSQVDQQKYKVTSGLRNSTEKDSTGFGISTTSPSMQFTRFANNNGSVQYQFGANTTNVKRENSTESSSFYKQSPSSVSETNSYPSTAAAASWSSNGNRSSGSATSVTIPSTVTLATGKFNPFSSYRTATTSSISVATVAPSTWSSDNVWSSVKVSPFTTTTTAEPLVTWISTNNFENQQFENKNSNNGQISDSDKLVTEQYVSGTAPVTGTTTAVSWKNKVNGDVGDFSSSPSHLSYATTVPQPFTKKTTIWSGNIGSFSDAKIPAATTATFATSSSFQHTFTEPSTNLIQQQLYPHRVNSVNNNVESKTAATPSASNTHFPSHHHAQQQHVNPIRNSATTFNSYYHRPSTSSGSTTTSILESTSTKYTKNPSLSSFNATTANEMVMQRVPTLDPPNKLASGGIGNAVDGNENRIDDDEAQHTSLTTKSSLYHASTESVKNLTQIAVMLNKSNDTTMTKTSFNKNTVAEMKYKPTAKPNRPLSSHHFFDTTATATATATTNNNNNNPNHKYHTNNNINEEDKAQAATVKPINVEFLNDCITSLISNSVVSSGGGGGGTGNGNNNDDHETWQSVSHNGNIGGGNAANASHSHNTHHQQPQQHHQQYNLHYHINDKDDQDNDRDHDHSSSTTANYGNFFSRDQNKYSSSSSASSAPGTTSSASSMWDTLQHKVTLSSGASTAATAGEKQKENSHIYYYKLPPINSQPLKANANTLPSSSSSLSTSYTHSHSPTTTSRPANGMTTAAGTSADKTYQKITTIDRPSNLPSNESPSPSSILPDVNRITWKQNMVPISTPSAASTSFQSLMHTEARISSSGSTTAFGEDSISSASVENREASSSAIADTSSSQFIELTHNSTKLDKNDENSDINSTTKRTEPVATPQMLSTMSDISTISVSESASKPTTPISSDSLLSDLRKDHDDVSIAISNDGDDDDSDKNTNNVNDGNDDDDDDEDDEGDDDDDNNENVEGPIKEQKVGAIGDNNEHGNRYKGEDNGLSTKNQRIVNATTTTTGQFDRKTTSSESFLKDRIRTNVAIANRNVSNSNLKPQDTRFTTPTFQKNSFRPGDMKNNNSISGISSSSSTVPSVASNDSVEFVRIKLENHTTQSWNDATASTTSSTSTTTTNKQKDDKNKITLAKNQPPKQNAATTSTTSPLANSSWPSLPNPNPVVSGFRSPAVATSTLIRPPSSTAGPNTASSSTTTSWTVNGNGNANGAAPTVVELHPAPHENMGLEASVAYLGDDVKTFIDLCNELSFKIWTWQTAKSLTTSRSIVLSPFALLSTLAMIFLGARGSSSGIMNDFLRLDDMVTFNPHQVFRNITESAINSKNTGAANVAFVHLVFSDKTKGNVLEFYKERLQQYYDTYVEEINFNAIGDLLRRRTNLLVKRQTQGRIQDYLRGSSIAMKPPLATFTANIFQTDCSIASTEGRDGEMYFVVRPSTRQRRLVPIPAVVYRGGFLAGYEPGLDATAVTLSPDSIMSTILVLPGQQGQVAPGDGLARLEQRLLESSYRRGAWSRLLRSLLFRHGLEVQIPRFSHKSILNLTVGLQKMGMGEIFAPEKADLRGINGLLNELHLSDCVQANTFSTCGEESIGARHHVETFPSFAQRTSSGPGATGNGGGIARHIEDLALPYEDYQDQHSLPPQAQPLNSRPRQARLPDNPRLRFDRPFLYIVRHNPTGMILYIGRFNPRLLP